jgi:hypothetical protein
MKRLLIIALLLVAPGPAFAMGGWVSPETTAKVLVVVDTVQKAAIAACNYLPYATSIGSANITLAGALVFADKLCEIALKHGAPAEGAPGSLMVDGVEVSGQFVGAQQEEYKEPAEALPPPPMKPIKPEPSPFPPGYGQKE